MLPPGLETPRQVQAYYDQRYNAFIDSGEYFPFIYPWATLGPLLCFVYLLFDHRQSPTLQALRFPIFGVLVAFSAWTIFNVKARSAPAAYGVGLVSAWGTLWIASLMFFNDCQRDFQRLERADEAALHKALQYQNGTTVTGPESDEKLQTKSSSASASAIAKAKKLARKAALQSSEAYATQLPCQRTGPVFWQSYPTQPFLSRLDWIMDLFCNFRGIGWNFQTSGIPKPPKYIELQLLGYDVVEEKEEEKEDMTSPSSTSTTRNNNPKLIKTVSYTGITRFITTSRHHLLQYIIPRLILQSLALDIIKTLMHHDPYFWGYTDSGPPSWLHHLLPHNNNNTILTPILLQTYRLLLSLLGILLALNIIFRLSPLLFCQILRPQILGLRGEPLLNPVDFFGNFFPQICHHGLAGWWGGFWHQTFRFAFTCPTERILEFWWWGQQQHMEKKKKTARGKMVGVIVAFGLSGFLHACGSWTQLGDTRPVRGPWSFFMLQAVGIIVQTGIAGYMKARGWRERIPSWVRGMGNFALTMIWLYWTAPLLVDDFARGGVWLYEPLIISPLRILGFGAYDDSGWNLWSGLVFWRSGRGWRDTGLAF